MAIYFSLLIAIVGLVIYFATKDNAKLAEVARIAYAMGLLAFLLQGVDHLVSVLR